MHWSSSSWREKRCGQCEKAKKGTDIQQSAKRGIDATQNQIPEEGVTMEAVESQRYDEPLVELPKERRPEGRLRSSERKEWKSAIVG